MEFKNARIGVWMKKLWLSKVEVVDFAWVCENLRDSPCKMSATWNNF